MAKHQPQTVKGSDLLVAALENEVHPKDSIRRSPRAHWTVSMRCP